MQNVVDRLALDEDRVVVGLRLYPPMTRLGQGVCYGLNQHLTPLVRRLLSTCAWLYLQFLQATTRAGAIRTLESLARIEEGAQGLRPESWRYLLLTESSRTLLMERPAAVAISRWECPALAASATSRLRICSAMSFGVPQSSLRGPLCIDPCRSPAGMRAQLRTAAASA